jgi:hypothetical protein
MRHRKLVRAVVIVGASAVVATAVLITALVIVFRAPLIDFSGLDRLVTARCRDGLVPTTVTDPRFRDGVGCVPQCTYNGTKPCVQTVESTLPSTTTTTGR